MKVRNLWMILWGIIYILGFKLDCFELLGNKGIHIIKGQYYRFFTGLLVHVNIFHLLINIIVLYWVYYFIDKQVSEVVLILLPLASSILTCIVFSIIYPDSQSIGGSPVIFSLLGIILALQLFHKDLPRFQPNSAYGYWILGYAVLGNIPFFSGNISILIIHALSFIISFIISMISIKLYII